MGRYAVHLKNTDLRREIFHITEDLNWENSKIPVFPVVKFERLSKDDFDLVTKLVNIKHSAEIPIHSTSGRFLLPKQAVKTEVEKCAENENKTGSEKYTNRKVTISKNTEMWNEVFREHQNVSPHCNSILEWDLSMEEKWGSAWRECAKCTKCLYRSNMFNLYEEVASITRGRRAAKIDLGLQVGLHHTPISTTSYPTQCAYTVAEHETYKHCIINTLPKSKLCSKKRKHTDSTKVGEHAGPCTANINMQDSIELKEDGLEVNEVTTDPDSSAYRAAESLFQEGLTSTTPIHFLDTRHVASNHRKFVNNLSAVCDIIPARLKVQRTRLQSLFASDISARCQAEYVQANIRYHKSPDVMKSKLSYVSDAIVGCYYGDHTNCSLYSFVCSKSRKSQSWIDKSAYLKRHNFEIS
ncbi:unnamed protein product [Mytilus coruscus]|uniref:Mutator-like transposase domain-containing protein n=1 Tax=Mytilus coruscus TaxID=42192 RepID=A0A6J8D6R4_MYTCO|nr:unnamed protein product [Mytilus coruscus]